MLYSLAVYIGQDFHTTEIVSSSVSVVVENIQKNLVNIEEHLKFYKQPIYNITCSLYTIISSFMM